MDARAVWGSTSQPWTPAAATYLSPKGGNVCLFWKGFVLHITNGNIQLGLRPQSTTELTTHHKYTPTGNLLPLASSLSWGLSDWTCRSTDQFGATCTKHTSLLLVKTATPHLCDRQIHEKLTINYKELDLDHRFLAQKKPTQRKNPPSQAPPPGPSYPLQQSAFSFTNTADSKQGTVQTPCPSQLKNPSRSHLHCYDFFSSSRTQLVQGPLTAMATQLQNSVTHT